MIQLRHVLDFVYMSSTLQLLPASLSAGWGTYATASPTGSYPMWRHLQTAVRGWLLIMKPLVLSSIFGTLICVVAQVVCKVTMSSEATIRVRHLNGEEYPSQISLDVRSVQLSMDE